MHYNVIGLDKNYRVVMNLYTSSLLKAIWLLYKARRRGSYRTSLHFDATP